MMCVIDIRYDRIGLGYDQSQIFYQDASTYVLFSDF